MSQDIERYIRIRDFLVGDIHDHRFGEPYVRERIDNCMVCNRSA